MIVVDRGQFLFRDKEVFFPNIDEIKQLSEHLPLNGILRIRQTPVELRIHPYLIRSYSGYSQCIDLTNDISIIYREMHPNSCRYKIRKAEKVKERIQISRNSFTAYEDLFNLYRDFVRLKKLETTIPSQRLFRKYMDVYDAWVIYFDDRPICGHLLVPDTIVKRVHLYYSANTRLRSEEDAKLSSILNRYLHWQEIQSYKSQGLERYDFGHSGLDSLKTYKLSFGGFQVQAYNYVIAGKLVRMAYKPYQQLMKVKIYLQNRR